MKLFVRLLISTVSVWVASYIIPGVSVEGYFVAFTVAIVLGVLNVFVKPILVLLTLPISLLTLGLFSIVINVFIIMLASYLVPGFHISGFFAALFFGLVVSLINSLLNKISA